MDEIHWVLDNYGNVTVFPDFGEANSFVNDVDQNGSKDLKILVEVSRVVDIDIGEEFDESMDGDHESALSSAGWGTDEDYDPGERL